MIKAAPTTNDLKCSRLLALLDELLKQALRRGFHGAFKLEVTVQDGVIQHIRRGLEQTER